MNEMDFEGQIRAIANRMEYPPTPNIAGSVSARIRSSTRPRFTSKAAAWSLTIVLVLISSLMLIPSARAAILEFIRVGVVRIFRVEPTPIPTPASEPNSNAIPVTATPGATRQPLIPLLESLAGEMTLEDAQARVDYPILLPSYPLDLGQPDRIFVQDAEGMMTILIWLDPQQPDRVLLSLHFIPTGSWAINKMGPKVIQETQVNGQYAVWAEGTYPLRVRGSSEIEFTRLIDGHVLIWEDGDITYRLETDLTMEEAIKIAESLKSTP
jgi:hypothetical protein